MNCHECKTKCPPSECITFKRDDDSLYVVCKVCMDKKVSKGIKNRSWYDVEKMLFRNNFKQL